jgi:hypothetical protein
MIMRMYISIVFIQNYMEGTQKTTNRTTYDPAIPLLALYPKKC